MAYNYIPSEMRDTSTDQERGWISPGEPFTEKSFLSGLGAHERRAVKQATPVGQEYINEALADPEAAPILKDLLASSNPGDAMAKQAQQDAQEAFAPTGKVIVFKRFAGEMAGRLKRVEAKLISALPNKGTAEAEEVLKIVNYAEDKEQALKDYYEGLALEALAPGLDWEGDAIGFEGLGRASKAWRRWKSVAKVFKVVGIAAAAVVAAPLVISGVSAAVGAVGSVAKAVFSGGAAKSVTTGPMPPADYQSVTPPGGEITTPQYPGGSGSVDVSVPVDQGPSLPATGFKIPWTQLASFGVQVFKAKQAQSQATAANKQAEAAQHEQAAQQAHQESVAMLVRQGVPQAEAEQYVQQAEQQAQQQMPAPPPPPPPPPVQEGAPSAPGDRPTVVTSSAFDITSMWPLLVVGGAVFLFGGKGGSGSRTRRNPRRR